MKKWRSTIAVGLAFSLSCAIPVMAQIEGTEADVLNVTQSDEAITHDAGANENTVTLEDNIIEVVDCEIAFDTNENLQSLGLISTKTAIVIDGEDNQLYCTFDNPSEAIENVKTKIPALLNVLKDKYDLDELSEANWEDYKNIMGDYESNIDYQSVEYQELSILSAFFDIYENESKNQHIIQLASAGNARMINDEQLEELILYLPSRSPASKKYQSIMKQSVKSSGMDRNATVSYAEEYAQWPNSSYYFYGKGDCANFVSQILANSGIQYTDKWWYDARTAGDSNHSRQWAVADDFCGYFGVDFETEDFETFANKAVQTDILAYDITNDWDWDHVAFVTDTTGTVEGGNYKDIRIAQHTSNYVKWVEETGWPTLKADNPDLVFGIIYGRLIR